ncbi:MAG: cyclodeaminase/cyclohydrolase family protein [Planctomycetota bacterium]
MYIGGSIKQYIDDAASGKPAPGGGSVSALAAALGASMGSMVCNFTVGKEKFKEVEPRAKEIMSICEKSRTALLSLMDRDVEEYSKVTAAYGMPKETDEQKTARKAAIQEALKSAMLVPLEAFRACLNVLEQMKDLAEIGNPNLISDVGVAAILSAAGLAGAKLNVDINLSFIKDEELIKKVRNEVENGAHLAKNIEAEVVAKVKEKIG